MLNTNIHKLLRILKGQSFKQFEISKLKYSFISTNYLESNPAKNEVTVHGKNVFHPNKITYNVESNISINWA